MIPASRGQCFAIGEATRCTGPVWLVPAAIGRMVRLRVATSHRQTTLSLLPSGQRLAIGLKATLSIALVSPDKGWPTGFPVATSATG